MIKKTGVGGFTLIELLMVTAIVTFVAGGVIALLLGSQRAWAVGEAKIQASGHLRPALERIARELRHSSQGSIWILDYDPAGSPFIVESGPVVMFQVPVDLDGDGYFDFSSGMLVMGAENVQGNFIAYGVIDRNLVRVINSSGGSTLSVDVVAANIESVSFSGNSTTPRFVTIELTARAHALANMPATVRESITVAPRN